jgi:hypothetical protein
MAQKVGDLYAELKLKKDNFEKNLTTSERRIQKFKQGATTAFKALSVAVAAVSAAIVKAVGDTIKYTNEVRKASKATGVAVEKFQELAYAAKQEHGNTQALEKGLGNLTIRLGYAGDGLETYLRYFRTLGIEYKKNDGTLRNTEDVFRDIAEVASTGALTTEKLAAITQLFGARAGRELVPMLRKGTEWFDKMAKEADNLGIIMSEKDIESAKAFDDKMTALKETSNALKRVFVTGLLPSLNSTAEMFKENAEHSGGLRDSIKDVGEWVGRTGIILMRFVNNTRELMTDFGAHMTNVLASTLEGLSKIPGIGKGFEEAAHNVRMLNIGFVEQGIALQENEDKYNTMLNNLGKTKEVIDDISNNRPPDAPPGALLPPPFEPQVLISEMKELEPIKMLAGDMNIFADAIKTAEENAGELFGTMIQSGMSAEAVMKRLIGQFIRMTFLKSFGPLGGIVGGFMRAFGMQHGGVVSGMPMMNMRPDLAVANENPNVPEAVMPLDAEKLAGLFQVNVHSADPGTTVDIVLKGLKGVKGQALADSLTRDIIAPALSRDSRR